MTEIEPKQTQSDDEAHDTGAPEPPVSYDPKNLPHQNFDAPGPGGSDFESLRRLTSASQIMALVSLVIGGVILSTAAVIVSVIAYRRLANLSSSGQLNTVQISMQAFSRSAKLAIIMSVLALAINAATLVMLYPTMVEIMQTGDYSSLLNGSQSAGESSGSFWG